MPRRPTPHYILTLSCSDRPCSVAAVAESLAGSGCNILDSAQFGDTDTGRFMMRVVFEPVRADVVLEDLRQSFASIPAHFGMLAEMHDALEKPRVLILVSKQDHCLN